MAGIGFELKKMFSKKGLFSVIKAYGYAGIVCVGPMILGVVLLLGIRALAGVGGAGEHQSELLNSMVTYSLLCSMVLTNSFSLVTTRYTADMLYMEEKGRILPSFWGSIAIMLTIGGILYGIFLWNSGISSLYQMLCLMLFGELIVVWTEMNYLTAIKDYKGIIFTFAIALLFAWVVGSILLKIGIEVVAAMLLAVCIAYGLMMLWYYHLMISYFPKEEQSPFLFLEWFDRYPQLSPLGLFLSLGLFGHLVIMWTSPVRVQIQGLFYGAPLYDISALLAFFSILVTTINFVTSVEVNFYPRYRNYYSLFNDGGSLMDIRQAQKEMMSTLTQELTNTFTKQFFATIVFIIAGTMLLPHLPLGMTDDMLGIYRVLCVAYAFYAVGNCVMLIQLYFADNRGACISGLVFMLVSCVGTIITGNLDITYYGIGFLAGSVAFTGVSLLLLWFYLKKLMYHVLCSQPIVAEVRRGFFTRISKQAYDSYDRKYGTDLELPEEEEEF